MKVWHGVTIVFCSLAFPVLTTVHVYALSGEPFSDQIQISATVAPMRFVVIDQKGGIEQIISNNSSHNSGYKVYVKTVKLENEVPLTPVLAVRIDKLLGDRPIKPGVIYRRSPANLVLTHRYALPFQRN